MSWEYTQADLDLCRAIVFQLKGGAPGSDGQNRGGKIEFQFPPKITSDSRKGDWVEEEKPGSEPTFEYKKSGAREISMNWTYVVDSFQQGGWTIGRITSNIRTLRGYFAQSRNPGSNHENLVIKFKMWSIGGTGGGQPDMTCLIKSVDVKYGDTIVAPPRGGFFGGITAAAGGGSINTDQAFFLRSDITVDLRIWTQGEGEGGGDILEKVDALYKRLDPAWY